MYAIRSYYAQEDIFRNFDLNDILRQFGFGGGFRPGGGGGFHAGGFRSAGGGTPFDTIFGGAGMRGGCGGGGCGPQPVKGGDLTYELHISLEDVLHGAEKTISLRQGP